MCTVLVEWHTAYFMNKLGPCKFFYAGIVCQWPYCMQAIDPHVGFLSYGQLFLINVSVAGALHRLPSTP